jgi:hypothetical protein
MAWHKPKLDGLVIDLANMRRDRPRVYGYWPPRVGVKPKSVATRPTVAPQVATMPRDPTRQKDEWPAGHREPGGFVAM